MSAIPLDERLDPYASLAKADLLDLLRREGEVVLVPDTVAREVRAHSPDAAQRSLDSQSWLRVVSTPPIPPLIEAWDLGAGESSVLAWAHAHQGSVAILDDLAARRCAHVLGIACRGCVGLTLLVKRRGLHPTVRPLLQRLRDAGLYLGESVVKRVLALAGE